MLKYHHLGIPTNDKKPNETYLEEFKMYVSGFDESEYKIEWMRILPESDLPEIVKDIPHIAFEVEDLELAIKDKKLLIKPNKPSPEFIVAFIEENGAPIEFIQKIK
ncbi:MAG: hypothetical protein H6613_05390 [Ignavibacteriales bacterium]|nr:hypothetical protein [Ignavibacteriales bacterium]